MGESTKVLSGLTIGLDLGDDYSYVCILDAQGEKVDEGRVKTTRAALKVRFESDQRSRIALEAGTHSPWVSRLLEEWGHEVLVANPRKLRLIYENHKKTDEADAEYLARVARLDPKLLAPVVHRDAKTQADLAVLRSREAMVQARTKLINHVRGSVKAMGHRLPKVSSASFGSKAEALLPNELRPALAPVIEIIRTLTQQIHRQDAWVERVAEERYPSTRALQQVSGVGALTSLAYVLTLEDPHRFPDSRTAGAFVGLCPKQAQSGKGDPQLRISKAGDGFLRKLLVGSAHYILGPFGSDCDLRRWGQKLAERGGKNAKKRAVVAVARKLAVLLHRLWVSQETYEPLRGAKQPTTAAPPAAPGSRSSLSGEGGGRSLRSA